MYYEHKKYTIEAHKLSLINELFQKYDLAELGRISPKDARILLRQIGIDANTVQSLVLKADPQQRGSVRKEILLEVIREFWGYAKSQQEIHHVFQTIRELGMQRNHSKECLTIEDLRLTANHLGESFTEQDLREMMEYADPEKNGSVSFSRFQTIMRKTV